MKTIRKNVFETNSSSTHSIAIPSKPITWGNYISFNIGEFGWEWRDVDPADYLYTAILTCSDRDYAELYIDKMKNVLERNGINYRMQTPQWDEYNGHYYLKDGYIDHSSELGKFLEVVFSNDESLLNFIFGGLVFTGNDNADEDQMCFINRNEKTYESYENGWGSPPTIKDNPYYMEDCNDYDWHYKYN